MTANYAGLQSPTKLAGLVITIDPTVSYDKDAGFGAGDVVYNTTNGLAWQALSVASGAAVWVPLGQKGLIGRLIGANMNVTTDQAFQMLIPTGASYRVTKVSSKNALVVTSLTTAHGGVYTAISKGGTAIVADGATNFAGQTTTAAVIDLTVVTAQLALVQSAAQLYLSLTAGQGAACTSDLYIFGDIYF